MMAGVRRPRGEEGEGEVTGGLSPEFPQRKSLSKGRPPPPWELNADHRTKETLTPSTRSGISFPIRPISLMKITVIGAGAIGSAVASDLLDMADVAQVQVCEARVRSLQKLRSQVEDHSRLRSFQVDARDLAELEPIIAGSDCVIGCARPQFNPALAALCLSQGIHYCDLGSTHTIVEQELALHEQAREKGIWIVPNCGLDPGLVSILCRYGVAQFDTVDTVRLRLGDVPLHPEPPFNFRISWSADKLLDDYTDQVFLIEDGTIKDAKPLTHEEQIHFPEPFGEMEAFYAGSGLFTLTHDLASTVQTLDHKLIRWPGHASQMRFLLALGFGEDRSIDVRTHLTYRDVLLRRMQQRLGGPHQDAVLLRVLVQGLKEGQKKTLIYEMVDRYDEARGVTAMQRCTSIPTACIAVLLASGRVPGGGAATPETIIPHQEFYDMVTARGLNISATWHDTHVSVENPEG